MGELTERLVALRISRRRLLTVGALAAATTVAPLGGSAVATALAADPYRAVSRKEYSRQVGSSFRLHVDAARTVDLTLEAIHELPAARNPRSAPTAQHDAFSLVFRGPARSSLAQGMYRMDHAVLGPTMLLLVPGARDGGRPAYSATINRL